ncbi:uncharacterized protein KY384_003493 [Bacidia gigantensis]|uniref:uncharacterized protein n=1 Tax=Bacidia gigantensis TaxID=2732470 RepID=UPI001D04D0F2|nr:uncharacterized protein KY384_003493 [Bacidia gigantensis]KAG8531857.1 hypothetical protein KY384_003493 [Bacidia gigantensis]
MNKKIEDQASLYSGYARLPDLWDLNVLRNTNLSNPAPQRRSQWYARGFDPVILACGVTTHIATRVVPKHTHNVILDSVSVSKWEHQVKKTLENSLFRPRLPSTSTVLDRHVHNGSRLLVKRRFAQFEEVDAKVQECQSEIAILRAALDLDPPVFGIREKLALLERLEVAWQQVWDTAFMRYRDSKRELEEEYGETLVWQTGQFWKVQRRLMGSLGESDGGEMLSDT